MKTLLLGVGMGALLSLSALTSPAQMNQKPAEQARANAAALRQYEWKRRTEVQRKGETKNVQVALVRYDANGRMQTTPISGTTEPDLPKFGLRKAIAEKKFKEFKETVQQLGELARSYGELPPEQMQRFMASATVSPELVAGQQLIRAAGGNVLHAGDSMTIWIDASSRKQRRAEIQTVLDGKPVRIVSEFKDLPASGPTYMAVSRINYDDNAIAITTENFDHQPVRKETAALSDYGWPRKFAGAGSSFAVYQPQIEQWIGNRWTGRAAFSVANGSNQPSYGVLWFEARTEIDKVNRMVTFSEVQITKVSFPSAPEKSSSYQAALQSHVTQKGEAIALDRVLTEMAVNDAQNTAVGYLVKNDPPRVFFSTRPALLVLIDGAPVLRAVEGTELERVVNTRVLILHERQRDTFYLRLLDGWLEANDVAGPWRLAVAVPSQAVKALEILAAKKQVDLLAGPDAEAKPALNDLAQQNSIPEIYVSTEPAELLQTEGEPQVAIIPGTQLVYVTNTQSDILVDTAMQTHYILVAGRWFGAQSMKGPWNYVAADKLPADFARIPVSHAKANVLVSVPGTPQAKEALIANSIPQTATITRSAADLSVKYDGAPHFKSIEHTTLQYAVNTSTPVIAVNSNSYYAVHNGVWFVATSPVGPWTVAATVPAIIYSIPVSSPLHYVTYVKIYGSTPEVVYVGYTPGYCGTVVSSNNVVVYGTGWYYPPYVGAYWYGSPYTYGYGVAFTWGVATGWSYAYAANYYYASAWPVTYASAAYYGWGGVAAANVYGQSGNVAYSGTRAAWANPYTGNVGYGGVYRGTNTVTGTRYAARGGTNTNVYTGTTVTGGGGVAYNPNTGRISAGQVGTATNVYTGNTVSGARGVTYNPNTNTGVAVANNNVYADRNGNIYRYNQSTGVQQRTENGWESVQRSQDRSWVQNQHQARSLGQQRTDSFSAMRANGGGLRGNSGGGGFRGRRR